MIPVLEAREIAHTCGMRQVIIFGWDGEQTHVTTYGKSDVDSAQAAAGANMIKRGWEWPTDTIVEGAKVQALYNRIAELEQELADLDTDATRAP